MQKIESTPKIVLAGRQTNEDEVLHLYNEIKSLHKKFTSKSKVLITGVLSKKIVQILEILKSLI